MTERTDEIVSRLAEAAVETVVLFRSLTPAQQERVVHGESETPWRARDLLAHFVTIERSMHQLFADMLAGGPGTGEDFDLERFNRSQVAKLADASLESLIAQFEEVRAETIRMVGSMQDRDLERVGRHPFHGQGRLERFVRWANEHTALHEAELRDTLESQSHEGAT